jgi:hypothetical protein
MDADLHSILLDIDTLSDEEAYEYGEQQFQALFLGTNSVGQLELPDDPPVFFYKDRYYHAFRSSADRAKNPYSKAKIARDRIERIRWIKEILLRTVPGTECWHVKPQSGRNHPLDRLYVHWDYGYVIWLQPRQDGQGWRFSSAYPVPKSEIGRYTRGGKLQFRVEKKLPRD